MKRIIPISFVASLFSIVFVLVGLFSFNIFSIKSESDTREAYLRDVSEEEANLIEYDYATGTKRYLYFENSYWEEEYPIPLLEEDSFSPQTRDYPEPVDYPEYAPYRYVAMLQRSEDIHSTGFFIGPNLLLTAGHCVVGLSDFHPSITIYPGYSQGHSAGYGGISPLKCIISKEYYNFKVGDVTVYNSWLDWAILIVEKTSSLTSFLGGNFGKIANFSQTNITVGLIGYPSDEIMQESYGTISGYGMMDGHRVKIVYDCPSAGGASGSPVFIEQTPGHFFAIGIHTYSGHGILIDSFIYRLTNSILADKGVEVRDYYFDEVPMIYTGAIYSSTAYSYESNYYQLTYYNCVVKYIISPKPGEVIYCSQDGINFPYSFSSKEIRYYTSGSSSSLGQYEYEYFKIYANNSFSSVISVSDIFSVDERSSLYSCFTRTSSGTIIDSNASYNQGNYWNCSSHFGQRIKGSIVYNGICRNIELSIPYYSFASTNIEIDDVVFTLSVNISNFSLKANSTVTCNQYDTFFAFQYVS